MSRSALSISRGWNEARSVNAREYLKMVIIRNEHNAAGKASRIVSTPRGRMSRNQEKARSRIHPSPWLYVYNSMPPIYWN